MRASFTAPLAWSASTDDPDVVEVFYSYGNEDIGVEAGEVACDMLAANNGMIASFSRALTEGLTAQQSDAEFDRALDAAIQSIYEASKT